MRIPSLLSLLWAGAALGAQAQQVPPLVQSANPNQTASLYAGETIELQPGFGTTTEGFEARLAPAAVGEWSAVFDWGPPGDAIVGVHTHVLPDGQVLSWQGHNNNTATPSHQHTSTYKWNGSASSPTFLHLDIPENIFCSGHSFLANGKLLVAGGHDHTVPYGNFEYILGLRQASTFNFNTSAWQAEPIMGRERWYPTVTTLSNGEALAVGGETAPQSGNINQPEVFRNGTWSWLSSASLAVPLYPWMFAAPNGKVFMAGNRPPAESRYLDTNGTGAWSAPFAAAASQGVSYTGARYYGSPVLYNHGKLLLTGGSNTDVPAAPVTNTTQLIDLVNGPTPPAGADRAPVFRPGAAMLYPRMHHNATVLPDGTVLVTGGSTSGVSDEDQYAVLPAELWTPPAPGSSGGGSWARLASMRTPRLYHSTAVLLPDGRVLTTGGGQGGKTADHRDAEVFSPPYLFKGARPTIDYAPPAVAYGRPFTVRSPEWAAIARVTWVRLSSVTHALNMNQRFDELAFTRTGGALAVTPPATPNDCPPGHYMLFLLDGNGVPSPAAVVSIGAGGTCGAAASIATSVAPVGGGCNTWATATVSGSNLGTDYRWTINGQSDARFDGMTSVRYALDICEPQASFVVQVSSACSGPVVTAQASASAQFPLSCSCLVRE